MNKISYPNPYGDFYVEAPYDLQKWTETARRIYATMAQSGCSLTRAQNLLTQDWDTVEKSKFGQWLSYYQSGQDKAYKKAATKEAQLFNNQLNFLKSNLAPPVDKPVKPALSQSEDVERKIRSIVSRLQAAERLATDPVIQVELNNRLDIGLKKWLEELQAVKRQVQMAPLRHIRSTILEDIIIKRANILHKDGFVKAAAMMTALAQTVPNPTPQEFETNPAATPGTPLSLPTENNPPLVVEDAGEGKDAMDELVERMNGEDDSDADDSFAADDKSFIVDIDDDPLFGLKVQAQAAPQPIQTAPEATDPSLTKIPEDEVLPEGAAVPGDLEVEEGPQGDELVVEDNKDEKKDIFDAALANITVQDIIDRLEAVANILRTRAIPREYAIIDLMMDKVNILPFFPSLGEASARGLEGNQYQLTRVDEILSRLRGAIATSEENRIDLGNENAIDDPQTLALRNSLKEQGEKEKARKERRKQEELDKATPKEETPQAQPITDVKKTLEQPVELPQAPAPTAPQV